MFISHSRSQAQVDTGKPGLGINAGTVLAAGFWEDPPEDGSDLKELMFDPWGEVSHVQLNINISGYLGHILGT